MSIISNTDFYSDTYDIPNCGDILKSIKIYGKFEYANLVYPCLKFDKILKQNTNILPFEYGIPAKSINSLCLSVEKITSNIVVVAEYLLLDDIFKKVLKLSWIIMELNINAQLIFSFEIYNLINKEY